MSSLSEQERTEEIGKMGFNDMLHNLHCPVGKIAISENPQKLACTSSITDWQQKMPHAPHVHMIAKLANNPNVNLKKPQRLLATRTRIHRMPAFMPPTPVLQTSYLL